MTLRVTVGALAVVFLSSVGCGDAADLEIPRSSNDLGPVQLIPSASDPSVGWGCSQANVTAEWDRHEIRVGQNAALTMRVELTSAENTKCVADMQLNASLDDLGLLDTWSDSVTIWGGEALSYAYTIFVPAEAASGMLTITGELAQAYGAPMAFAIALPVVADDDGDGLIGSEDNCTLKANPDQRDTDGDGYGNACDPDLNNDGLVDEADLDLIRDVFFSEDPDADFNGDGWVNAGDLAVMKELYLGAPGPSGQVTPN